MVFAVGDDDDGLALLAVLRKTLHGQSDGLCHVRALRADERRVDVLQEEFGRHIVARDGQLDEGVAGEDHHSYLVVAEVIHQVLHHDLALLQSRRRHVLRHHGVADVEADHRLYALSLLVRDAASRLRAGDHDDHQGDGRHQQPKLDSRAPARDTWRERSEQGGIAQERHALPLAAEADDAYCHQCRDEQQQPKVC